MDKTTEARTARASFLERAEEFTPIVAVDAEGARFLLRTSDDNITPPLFLKRSRGEIRSLRRVRAALAALGLRTAGGSLVDVGANIGTTTVSALREHGFERAVACEPEPRNVRLLELNLVANGLDSKVAVCPVAVGESDREVELLVLERQAGLHEVRPRGRPLPNWPDRSYRTVAAAQVTLDMLAAESVFDADDVTLLWMDVQGHEAHVLAGAESLAARGVPTVLELYPEALRRHGGLGLLKKILRDRYTHFVPLRGRLEQPGAIPIRRLGREIDRLLGEGRFTDVLLVRDPVSAPTPGETTLAGSVPASPATWRRRRRRPRRPDEIPARERREFLTKDARRFTPLVAGEIDRATFIVRTGAGAEERSLFTERSHPKLRRLERVMNRLDDLGLGEGARRKTFVDLEAGTGIATVAALSWHGFAAALACEDDPESRRVLELNLTANDLRTRAQTRRTTPRRIGRDRAGLIWAEAARDIEQLVSGGLPLVLRLEPGRAGAPSVLARLAGSYTHFVVVSTIRGSRPRPLSAIGSLSRARRPLHVLLLQLPAP